MKPILLFLLTLSLSPIAAQQLLWQQSFTASRGYGVTQTSDGGYIITGDDYNIQGAAGDCAVLLLKTDSLGQQEWRHWYEPIFTVFATSYPHHNCVAVVETPSGYVMAGDAGGTTDTYHPLLMKTDLQGNQLWATLVGGIATDGSCTDLAMLPNGDIAVCGTLDTSPDKGFLALTDSMGNQLWMQNFSEPGKHLYISSIHLTGDSSFLLSGGVRGTSSNSTLIWQAKVGWQGNLIWKKTGTVPGPGQGVGRSALAPDGGLVFGGNVITTNSVPISALWFGRVDTAGNLLWQVALPDSIGMIYDVAVSDSGDIYATGYVAQLSPAIEYNTAVLKLDAQGSLLWMRSLGTGQRWEEGASIIIADDGKVVVTGYSGVSGVSSTGKKVELYKISPNGQLLWTSESELVAAGQFHPNPFQNLTRLSLPPELSQQAQVLLYDMTGRLVDALRPDLQGQITWEPAGPPRGMYLYQIIGIGGKIAFSGKLIAE